MTLRIAPTSHFTEPTAAYWQSITEPAPHPAPNGRWQLGYPARLPDGRVLVLPIRQLASEPTHAVASLLVNQASSPLPSSRACRSTFGPDGFRYVAG